VKGEGSVKGCLGGGGRMGSRSRSMSENETGSRKQCGQGYPERK
jgi:hypothetical protein